MNPRPKAVIVSAVRTPIGSFNGVFRSIPATKLGGIAIGAALKRIDLPGDSVDQVIMGCVLTAGLGQAPARQASISAGLPNSVGATTVNKVCGSSLKSVTMAAQAIGMRDARIVVAGGMESMSRTPYLLERAGLSDRAGHKELADSLIKDGVWDVYNNLHMGTCAERCAAKYGLTRAEVDDFALESYRRAREAITTGIFKDEIVSVDTSHGNSQPIFVAEDEEPNRVDLSKMRSLRPAFQENGVLTAGNSSSFNDGAAALVVMEEDHAIMLGFKPLARIAGYAEMAIEPEWFTLAPVEAIRRVLKMTGLSVADIDLFEINEAFSAMSLAVNRELGLDPSKVNVNGGAVSLGHPIGATGSRILATLVHALEVRGARRGLVSTCIGGGEALAVVVERYDR